MADPELRERERTRNRDRMRLKRASASSTAKPARCGRRCAAGRPS